MKIVVLVKEVPDTYSDRRLETETGLADRSASDRVLDEIGERAIEVAMSHADSRPGTEVVLLSMGPEVAATSIRKGLALGADRAVQVVDPALVGADLGLTAEALAAAVRRVGFDLVIAGNQSTDGSGGMLGAMVAELLDAPYAGNLVSVELESEGVTGDRATDDGLATVKAAYPAVISITEQLPDARFPNFKGIMAAKKKPFDVLTLADLGVEAERPDAARSIVLAVAQKPPRTAGTRIVDDGTAGDQLADFLVRNRLA